MKPAGYLAMLLIAAIGIVCIAVYAPFKQPPADDPPRMDRLDRIERRIGELEQRVTGLQAAVVLHIEGELKPTEP